MSLSLWRTDIKKFISYPKLSSVSQIPWLAGRYVREKPTLSFEKNKKNILFHIKVFTNIHVLSSSKKCKYLGNIFQARYKSTENTSTRCNTLARGLHANQHKMSSHPIKRKINISQTLHSSHIKGSVDIIEKHST